MKNHIITTIIFLLFGGLFILGHLFPVTTIRVIAVICIIICIAVFYAVIYYLVDNIRKKNG